jgi:multiple antibiotic resistance protein
MELAIATIVALLPIINPFSAAPMFLTLTEGYSEMERREQARKAVIYMVCILVAFLIGGTFIMQFFGLSLPGLRIAGGILLAGLGMNMLYPKDTLITTPEAEMESRFKRDVSFIPLAMPSLAGPGSISVTIGLTSLVKSPIDLVAIIIGILIVAVSVFITLRLSTSLVKVLGVNGLQAMTKIMGFIILCIGVQFIVNGIIGVASSPELINSVMKTINSAP